MFESDLSKVLVSEKAGFAVIVSSVCLTDSFGCLPSRVHSTFPFSHECMLNCAGFLTLTLGDSREVIGV